MAEVYKIGVEIALAGTIQQGLEAISRSLTGINTKVKEVEGGFSRWGLAIGGVAALFGAGAIAKGLEKAVSQGGELVKQQTLLRNMGVSWADVLETTSKAQQATQKVIGTTIAENVKGMRELMGVMPNLAEAQAAFVPVMQTAKVLESLTGRPADQTMQTLAKAIELRGGGMNAETGKLDPERFVRETAAAQAAIVASGGLVNANSLYQFMQTAGPMARMMTDPNKFYETVLTAIMDMGGFRAGTAMTAAGRQLLGGKMTKPTAEEMERLGLLIPGMWHKSGVGVYVDPGGLQGESILKDVKGGGALEWANKILIPALAAAGITKPADIQQEMYRLFGTETARRMMGLYVQNEAQINRDKGLYWAALGVQPMVQGPGGRVSEAASEARGAGGGDAYGRIAAGDLGANVKNLRDAVDSFLQAFGAPMVPVAIEALQKLAGAVNSMAGMAVAHPEGMKMLGEGLIGLSAGLAALGATAVIAAAAAFVPGGATAAAVIGVGTTIAAITAMNWGGMRKALAEDLQGALQGFVSWLGTAPPEVKKACSSIIDAFKWFIDAMSKVAGAIGSVVHSVIQSIEGAFGSSAPASPRGGGLPHGAGDVPGIKPHASLALPHYAMAGGTVVHTHIHLDGREIASVVNRFNGRIGEFPRQAAAFDTFASYVGPDYSIVSS